MAGTRHRMLLIDDNSLTRHLLRQVLALALIGWAFIEAATVAEGLDRLNPPPDCVLIDLDLPDGSGAAILRKIRQDRLPTLVIVSSGATDPARLGEVATLRPDAVLPKPIDPERLCLA